MELSLKALLIFWGFLHGCVAALVPCELEPSVTSTEHAFLPASPPPPSCVSVLLWDFMFGPASLTVKWHFSHFSGTWLLDKNCKLRKTAETGRF